MTQDEHRLMVFMFTKQVTIFRALLEALKARGVLEPDDLMAYESLVRSQKELTSDLFESVAEQYTEFAKLLGLGNQLPPLGTK
jgi:hypothetical protein